MPVEEIKELLVWLGRTIDYFKEREIHLLDNSAEFSDEIDLIIKMAERVPELNEFIVVFRNIRSSIGQSDAYHFREGLFNISVETLQVAYATTLKQFSMNDQSWYIDRMRAAGYTVNEGGQCHGMSHMAMQAFLAKDMNTFNERLSRIQNIPVDDFKHDFLNLRTRQRQLIAEGKYTEAQKIADTIVMLFIKPTIFDSSTNMTVITNQHAYYFHLTSNQRLDRRTTQQTYALKFIYSTSVKPGSNRAATVRERALNSGALPKALNTAYRFSGSPQLVPLHVFDDGRFTYFELSANGPVPAIFAVDDKSGKESTVNTRRQGKYLVVQRLSPQFTLRQGTLATSVFNTKEISRIAQNRRPQ